MNMAYRNSNEQTREIDLTLDYERMKGNHPQIGLHSPKSSGKFTASIDGTGCVSFTDVKIEKNLYHWRNWYYSRTYTSKYTASYPYNTFKEEAKSEHTIDMRDLFSPNGVLSLALSLNEKSYELTSSNICYTHNHLKGNKESKMFSLGFNVVYGESNKYSFIATYNFPSGIELAGTFEANEGKPLHGMIKATVPIQDSSIDNLNYSFIAEVHSQNHDYWKSKFEFRATYKFNENWSVYGSANYNHHIENVQPIGVGAGVIYNF
jgi:hypothetical protein